MSAENDTTAVPQQVSRRALARTASWAVPTVAMTVTASPAFAASNPPKKKDEGLQGRVLARIHCRTGQQAYLSIEKYKEYPEGGLWVTDVQPGQTPHSAKLTFYFQSFYRFSWYNQGDRSWTNLYVDDTVQQIDGYTAWSTTYLGSWRRAEDGTTMIANTTPLFGSYIVNGRPGGCPAVRSYLRRTVTVNGRTISFVRGPITLQRS